jgi:hypothetical protein
MKTDTSRASRAAIAHNLLLLALIWAVGVAFGFGCLFNYQTAAGRSGTIPPVFPEFSRIERTPDRPTLIMFAHPRCPCTRASVGELAKVMAGLQNRVQALVVFYVPEAIAREWTDTGLVAEALAIPDVRVMHDIEGAETRLFGVKTSGHVLLYDNAGRLSFTGGITMARGHSGDNQGASELMLRSTQARSIDLCEQVVFGCPILDESTLNMENHNE